MSRFYIKRFEVEGLNCALSDFSIDRKETSLQPLSDVLCELSQHDLRFRFELADSSNQHPKLSRLIWANSNDPGMINNSDRYYELESSEDSFTKTEFRYTITDQFGQTVESNVDASRPIFSNHGPQIESGYSVRIDLIAISLPRCGYSQLLARKAYRDVSWIGDSDLILDL